jgi:TRAP-type mannitol/chloroaromatic compound transport system substrate-binding protein
MKRRNLLNFATFGTTSMVVSTACSRAVSEPPLTEATPVSKLPFVQWQMATSWPKSLEIVFGSADMICRRIGEMTDGRFAITPYEAGELVGGLEVLDAVSSGEVACGHTAGYYYVEKKPALAFATSVPFGLTAQQQNAWILHGGGLEHLRSLYADFGILNFPAGSTGAQMGGWFTRKVNTPEDFQGLKMRIPGLGGKVMTRLGVDVQLLLGEEIFTALETGAVQAAEWVGPFEDEKLGLNRVAPYYYYPGWWEPGTTYEIQVNLEAWNALPKAYQTVFQAAVAEAHLDMLSFYDNVNGQALEQLKLRGTELVPFSREILEAAERESFALYAEMAAADSTFKAVYESWEAFRNQVYQWNRVNELGFSEFAMRTSE